MTTTTNDIVKEVAQRIIDERIKNYWKFHPSTKDGFWLFLKYINIMVNSHSKNLLERSEIPLYTDKNIIVKKIAYALHDLMLGKYDNVLICCPPRSGKSVTLSLYILYCYLYVGGSFMRISYNQKLAEKFSRDVLAFMGTEKDVNNRYGKKFRKLAPDIFPDPNRRKVSQWYLYGGQKEAYTMSSFFPGAKGGEASTGLIFDDPMKDPDMESGIVNTKKYITKYLQTHKNRKSAGAKEVIVMTRVCDGDLADSVVEMEGLFEDGGKWKKIVIPALIMDEDGKMKSTCEYVWSTKYLEEQLKSWEKRGFEHIFWTLYQQNPMPASGMALNRQELQFYDTLSDIPSFGMAKNYTDPAFGGNDFTCGINARLKDGKWFILPSTIFRRADFNNMKEEFRSKCISDKIDEAIIEANNGGKIIADNWADEIGKETDTEIRSERHTTNKHERIMAAIELIKRKCVFPGDEVIKQFPELSEFMFHLLNYRKDGKNKNDDAIDALAGFIENYSYERGMRVVGIN